MGRINKLGTKFRPILDTSIDVQISELQFLGFLTVSKTVINSALSIVSSNSHYLEFALLGPRSIV